MAYIPAIILKNCHSWCVSKVWSVFMFAVMVQRPLEIAEDVCTLCSDISYVGLFYHVDIVTQLSWSLLIV